MPRLYDSDGTFREVEYINAYLLPGPDIYVTPRAIPLTRAVPKIITGNRPADGGNLILSEDEKNFFVKKYPQDAKFIRRLLGGEEFIQNKKRYCLWLVDATPDDIRRNKFIYERVQKCKEDRLKGAPDRQKLAETPHLFRETFLPERFVAIPKTSSERRRYIPIDFLDDSVVCTDSLLMIPYAQVWHFGILTSRVHMAWTKTVCGRLRNDLRYSAKIVYNNFVWVKMEFIDYANLILSAEKILKIRKNYPNASLADLYDDLTMPKDLREAHREVDKTVMKIYRLDEDMTDEEIAVEMLKHYKFVTDYLRENNLKQLARRDSEDDEDFEDE